jgi:hypothetical protein
LVAGRAKPADRPSTCTARAQARRAPIQAKPLTSVSPQALAERRRADVHHPATELEKLKGNDLNILSGVQLVAGLVPTVKGILDAATSNESIVAKGGGCCVSFQGLADDPTTMTEPTSPPPWFVREPEQAFVLNDASLLARSRDRPHIP